MYLQDVADKTKKYEYQIEIWKFFFFFSSLQLQVSIGHTSLLRTFEIKWSTNSNPEEIQPCDTQISHQLVRIMCSRKQN